MYLAKVTQLELEWDQDLIPGMFDLKTFLVDFSHPSPHPEAIRKSQDRMACLEVWYSSPIVPTSLNCTLGEDGWAVLSNRLQTFAVLQPSSLPEFQSFTCFCGMCFSLANISFLLKLQPGLLSRDWLLEVQVQF